MKCFFESKRLDVWILGVKWTLNWMWKDFLILWGVLYFKYKLKKLKYPKFIMKYFFSKFYNKNDDLILAVYHRLFYSKLNKK